VVDTSDALISSASLMRSTSAGYVELTVEQYGKLKQK
jgi:hypothetical protein